MAPTQTQTEGLDKKAKTKAEGEGTTAAKTPILPGHMTPGTPIVRTHRTVGTDNPPQEAVTISPSALSQNPFAPTDNSSSNAPGPKNRYGTPRSEFFTTRAKNTRRRISFGSVEPADEGTVYKMTTELESDKRKERINFSILKEVTGPFEDVSTNEKCFTDGKINPIACRAIPDLLKLTGHQGRLMERLKQAVEIGSRYVRRKVDIPNLQRPFLTKPAYRVAFKKALDILDKLLTLVVKYESSGMVGYGIEDEIYSSLEQELASLREEVYERLTFAGRSLRIPVWGRDGDTATIWNDNDFEIIGCIFRLEVEAFLTEVGVACELIPRTEMGEQGYAAQKDKKINPAEEISHEERIKLPIEGFSRRSDNSEVLIHDNQHDAPPSSISRAFRPNTLKRGKAWKERRVNLSVYGHPTDTSSGRGFQEMFKRDPAPHQQEQSMRATEASRQENDNEEEYEERGSYENGNKGSNSDRRHTDFPGDGPPDDSGDDDDKPRKDRGKSNKGPLGAKDNKSLNTLSREISVNEPRFDNRLKIDVIPTWDGDVDLLGRWVNKINRLSQRSDIVYEQLGHLVPSRLTGSAEVWYYSQSLLVRQRIEKDWGTLRDAIGSYYMNRTYMDRQKARANKASYRDSENTKETPSEYFIRKLELIDLVYDYSEIEIINEIMSSAPSHWTSILTPHLFQKVEDFQLAVKFHEENLMRLDWPRSRGYYPKERELSSRNLFNQYRNVRSNAVGWSKTTLNPPFPKDDANVSPKRTPEDKGARPCRHCGSSKHWDPECKYARKGEKRARVNMITLSEEDQRAQEDYDTLFYDDISEEDEEQDFHETLQEERR